MPAENLPLEESAPPAISEEGGVRLGPVAALVPENQSLTGLFGKTEISVLESIDWQFVKSMDESQVLGEEFASQAGDTDLSTAIRAGRSFSRETLAAAARTEQAKARTGQAFGLLLPEVTVRANYGSETSAPSVALDDEGNPIPKDTHDRTDVAWTVRQPLFDLPSYLDWRRRQVIEQASQESYRVSDGDAYLSTVNAYLTLVSTRLQTDLTRDFEAQLAELLSYIEKRAKGGAASVSDMARVRARSQETLSFRLEQEAAHEAAGIDFVRLTNQVPSRVRLPEFEDVGATALPVTFGAAVATAMKNNPEVAGLNAEIKAADIDKKVAKSQFLPRLDAEYTDTYSQHAGGDIEADGQRDKRGMLVLSWSPLTGGRDYQYYLERTARHKELQYRLDDERRRVVQALSANYSTLAITRERIKSGYRELKSISTAVDAMSKRMLSGNQSLLDLLDVYDRFYQARSRLVELHMLELSTMSQLVRLTLGTPWAVPVDGAPLASVELQGAPVDGAPPLGKTAATADTVPPPPVQPPPAGVSTLPVTVIPVAEPQPPAPPRRQTEVVPTGLEIPASAPPAVTKEAPVITPAPARSADDAYAPLWLDILPETGTALAVKNSGEAMTSAGYGVAAVTAVRGEQPPPAQSTAPATTGTTSGPAVLTLGLLDSGDQERTDQLVLAVESRLGQSVKVQLFAGEDALVNWFRRLRVVDMVVIPVGERGDLLAGDYVLLQAIPPAPASSGREILVARRDLSAAQLQRLEQAFTPAP